MPADLENEMRTMGDRLLAEAPPVTTDEVMRYSAERRSPAVTAIDPLIPNVPVLAEITDIRAGRRPSRRSAMIASVAAASMLVVGLGVATQRDGNSDPVAVGGTRAPTTAVDTTPAAPTSVAAPATLTDLSWPPRVLLDESWAVVDANERSANEGYMAFTRDGMVASVNWYRGEISGDEWYAQQGYTEAGTASMLGQTVTVYASSPMFATSDIRELVESGQVDSDIISDDLASLDNSLASLPEGERDFGDYIGGPILEDELAEAIDAGLIEGVSGSLEARIVWDQTSLSIQIRPLETGTEPPLDDLVAVLAALHPVEPTEWEAALPDTVVTPAERPAMVEELLAGVTFPVLGSAESIPQDVAADVIASLGDDPLVQNRGEIANGLLHFAACGWLNQYFAASNAGDPDAAAAALDAIATISDWPISQELAQTFEDAQANPDVAVIGVSNSGLQAVTVNDDGAIVNGETGDVIDGYVASQMCDTSGVG